MLFDCYTRTTDRYVVVGNHRDAWVYGAVDPSSGTAAFMEVSRVFGELRKEGIRNVIMLIKVQNI